MLPTVTIAGVFAGVITLGAAAAHVVVNLAFGLFGL